MPVHMPNTKLSLQRMFVTNAPGSFLKRQRRNKTKKCIKKDICRNIINVGDFILFFTFVCLGSKRQMRHPETQTGITLMCFFLPHLFTKIDH